MVASAPLPLPMPPTFTTRPSGRGTETATDLRARSVVQMAVAEVLQEQLTLVGQLMARAADAGVELQVLEFEKEAELVVLEFAEEAELVLEFEEEAGCGC